MAFALAIAAPAALAATAPAEPFRLEDQHGTEFSLAPPLERPLVLLIADRAGSEGTAPWVEKLQDRYGERVDLRGIANLTGLPGPFRALARRRIRAQADYPLLLDWTGEVSRAYRAEPGRVNVYVITPGGALQHETGGAPEEGRIGPVMELLDRLLGQ